MDYCNIKDLLKASHVNRWHTVDCVKEQSLSEHQWNVTMIAIRIAESIGLEDHIINQVMMKALLHDIDEIWTGDMPSPEKERLRANGSLSLEREPSAGSIHRSTVRVSPVDTGAAGEHVAVPIVAVVRAADLIDAYHWSSKYVLDKSVIEDCKTRYHSFRTRQPTEMREALGQITDDLGL